MSTEAQPTETDDQADHDDGLRARYGRYLSRRYLIAALGVYLGLALLGFYANWKFWSYFDLEYLRYAGIGDYLLAPVTLLRIVADPSFVVVFAIFGAILLLLVRGCGYGFDVIRNLRQPTSPDKPPPAAGGTLPFTEPWQDYGPLRACLRALAVRPVWAPPILALAAILAINANASAEKRDLRGFAKLVQIHAASRDHAQRRVTPYSRYELVSVATLAPAGEREHLVRMRSTDGFVFYYDVLNDQPLVISADRIATEVADGELAQATPALAGGGPAPGPAEVAANAIIRTADESPDRAVGDGAQPARASGGSADPKLALPSTAASGTAPPADGAVSSSQIAPAAAAREPLAAPQRASPEVILAMDPAVRDGRTALPGQQPVVHPQGPGGPPEMRSGASDPALAPDGLPDGLNVIETNVRQSQGSLDGLKSYLQQLQGSFVEINKFIKELDGSLKEIDQAFGQLAEQQVAAKVVAYADCTELTAAQPLEFGADDATLSLEAVGWLFQSRRQLAAPRSAERQDWLVIEGHANSAGQPAAEPPLAIRRATAVRDFLQAELGVSPDVVKIVGKGAAGPGARVVSLYDCLERRPAATSPATPAPTTTAAAAPSPKLGLVQSAAAGEVEEMAPETAPVRPAAWTPGTAADGLAAMLTDLGPQPKDGGLLVTVPGDRLFDTDSSRIRDSAYSTLGEIGEALKREPDRRALIVGHSDAIGDAAYNQILSERRARAVRDFLVDNFKIRSARLSVEGRGENEPIATNDTQDGRLANRRVEVLFIN